MTNFRSPKGDDAPDSRGSVAVPWRSPLVQVVLASTFLAPLGVPLVSPVLPLFRDVFALTDAEASLLISAYFAMGIVLSPFIGMLADRVGRRSVLIPCLFAFGLTGGATVFAPDYPTVLVLRLLQGTAAAGIFITTVTLIGDSFEGVQRNAVLGMNTAVLTASAAIFPIVGGALATIAWDVPFLTYLAALPVGLFAVFVLEDPPSERETRSLAYLRGAVSALAAREATVLYGTTFMVEFLAFGAILTSLPFFLTARFGLSPVSVGLIVTAVGVSSAVVSTQNGRFARRLSNHGLIGVGFGCYGVSLLGAWLAPSPLFIGLAVLVFGAGIGLILPSVDAAISDVVSTRFRAGALSLRNSTTFLGRTTGPIAFAALAMTTGYHALLLAAGVVALGCGLLVVILTGRTHRDRGVASPEEPGPGVR